MPESAGVPPGVSSPVLIRKNSIESAIHPAIRSLVSVFNFGSYSLSACDTRSSVSPVVVSVIAAAVNRRSRLAALSCPRRSDAAIAIAASASRPVEGASSACSAQKSTARPVFGIGRYWRV